MLLAGGSGGGGSNIFLFDDQLNNDDEYANDPDRSAVDENGDGIDDLDGSIIVTATERDVANAKAIGTFICVGAGPAGFCTSTHGLLAL